MSIYRQIILDHYRNPRNFGHLRNPDVTAEESNVSCGDRIVFEIRFEKDRETVLDIRFWGEGCAISQASASMLSEKAKGMRAGELLGMSGDDVIAMLGTDLTPSRIVCALLPLEVLQKSIGKYRGVHKGEGKKKEVNNGPQ